MGRSSGGGTTTSSVLTRLALGVLSALGLTLALVLLGSVQADADDLSDTSDSGAPERQAAKGDGLVGGVVSTVRSTVERPVGKQRSEGGSATSTKQRTAKPAKAERRTEKAGPRADRPQRRAERPTAGKAQQRSSKPADAKVERSADRDKPVPSAPRYAPTGRNAVRSTVATTAGTVDHVGRTVTATADTTVAGVDRDLDRVVAGVPVVRDVLPRQVLGSTTAPVTAAVDDVVATTTTLLGRTGDQVVDVVPDPATGRTDRLPTDPRQDVAAVPRAHAPTGPAIAGTAERAAPATRSGAPAIGGLHDRDVRSVGPAAASGATDLSRSDTTGDARADDAAQPANGTPGSTAAGSGASGGPTGGTGSAPAGAGAGAAYLSQLLVGLPGLTGSPVGTVDWVLPGSATADLGSSPD